MDVNKDGVVEWQQFLKAMVHWLQKSQALSRQISMSIGEVLPQEKKMMHLEMAKFFTRFQKDSQYNQKKNMFTDQNQYLKEKISNWDFFWEKRHFTPEQKLAYYKTNINYLENFSQIANSIINPQTQFQAVQTIVHLLRIVEVFQTNSQRFEISNHLIRIFDLIENSNIIK